MTNKQILFSAEPERGHTASFNCVRAPNHTPRQTALKRQAEKQELLFSACPSAGILIAFWTLCPESSAGSRSTRASDTPKHPSATTFSMLFGRRGPKGYQNPSPLAIPIAGNFHLEYSEVQNVKRGQAEGRKKTHPKNRRGMPNVMQHCICLSFWSTKIPLRAAMHLQIQESPPALGWDLEVAVHDLHSTTRHTQFNRAQTNSEREGAFKPSCVSAGDSKPAAPDVHHHTAFPAQKCFIQVAAIFRAWQIAAKRIHKHLPRITFSLCHLCTPFCLPMQEHSLEGIF